MIFILVHSIFELHPVYEDNLSLIMHYMKRITKSLKNYTFELRKNTKIIESRKSLKPYIAKSHLKTSNHTRKHIEAQEQQIIDDASQPKHVLQCFNTTKTFAQRFKDLQSRVVYCVIQRERVFQIHFSVFVLRNFNLPPLFEKLANIAWS